jgi:hypothetical protein
MARLARNLSIDYLRSVNYRNYTVSENLSESTQQIDQKFQVSYNPELIGVKDMTNILNEDQRSALDLIYFKGLYPCSGCRRTKYYSRHFDDPDFSHQLPSYAGHLTGNTWLR